MSSLPHKSGKAVAEYKYRNADGVVVATKYRFEPKSFRWSNGLNGATPPLYNLPDVLRAKEDGETIYIVEGEKDADNLQNIGLTATTTPHGAGSTSWPEEYTETLRDCNVVVIPDNDEPGHRHADFVAQKLFDAAKSVKVLRLDLGEHEDVSDWLAKKHNVSANGRNLVCDRGVGGYCGFCMDARTELEKLAEQAPEWSLVEQPLERVSRDAATTERVLGDKSKTPVLESPHLLAERIRQSLQCGNRSCACKRGKLVHCPAHNDEHPSLSVDVKSGTLLVKCHAGCSQEAVVEELRKRGLWYQKTGLVRRECSGSGDRNITPAHSETGLVRREVKQIERTQNKKSIGELISEALGILGDTREYFVYGRNVVRVEEKKHEKQPEVWLANVKRENVEEVLTTTDCGEVSLHASRIAKLILAKPLKEIQDFLPTIERFASNPLVLPNGEIITKQGLYPGGVYLAKNFVLPEAPDTPEDCLQRVLEPFCDFPFKTEADRANLLALILTPLVGLFTEQRPVFLVEAAKEGTGKSLLVKTALYISYGEVIPAQDAPRDDDEWRKLITTVVSQGWPVLFVDNVGKKLDSSALSAYATATRWQDRILGKNEGGVWPCHALVVCTANNPETSGEIARRIVPIRIEADCERPEERTDFKYPDLLKHIAQHQMDYLSCALKMISLWVEAGRPEPREAPPFGSFEEWRKVVGGILEFAGMKRFLHNLQDAKERLAEDTVRWREFTQKWFETYGTGYVTATKLLPIAEEAELVEEGVSARKFGRVLARHDGRVYGQYKIRYRQSCRDYYLSKPPG